MVVSIAPVVPNSRWAVYSFNSTTQGLMHIPGRLLTFYCEPRFILLDKFSIATAFQHTEGRLYVVPI